MAQHKWHKEIKAWADGAEIEARYEKAEGWSDWKLEEGGFVWYQNCVEYRIKPAAKCIVDGCVNHTNEGKFIGGLCAPCWEYITNGKGIHSQAYRNAHPKPQYLFVYHTTKGIELGYAPHEGINMYNTKLVGKIKLEVDDEQ